VGKVRLAGLTASEASGSNVNIDLPVPTVERAFTANHDVIYDDIGYIITNTGAVGSIHLNLTTYLPAPMRYRFRVTAAQAMEIDVKVGTEKILGTTAAGAYVTCNTVGEEAEAYYIGSIGGVNYWKLNILGNRANWTFL